MNVVVGRVRRIRTTASHAQVELNDVSPYVRARDPYVIDRPFVIVFAVVLNLSPANRRLLFLDSVGERNNDTSRISIR